MPCRAEAACEHCEGPVSVGMILEILVAVLLVVTVVYCALLDRRLHALRTGQDGLKALIEGLDGATRRAQSAIGELKQSADAAGATLSSHVTKGRALCDELQIMIEAGNGLADRLEGGRASARREAPIDVPSAGPRPAKPKSVDDWEDNLIKALREAR